MAEIFTNLRVGRPQILAACLLLALLAQSIWLIRQELRVAQADSHEITRLQAGLRQWHTGEIVGEPDGTSNANHSPLRSLIDSSPLLLWPRPLYPETFPSWGWLARLPSLLFGLALGSSLWYVARRLCGNTGGYIALMFYCFSPAVIRSSALWFAEPEMGAAWGAFGAIFTAIAVAHTLYAPREVILWNWRRILLLGLSLALAIGSQFSLILLAPAALFFMFYVAPNRRLAALGIWTAACVVALCLLLAAYSFHFAAFSQGLLHAHFFGLSLVSYIMPTSYRQFGLRLGDASPSLILLFPTALAVYLAWPRTRYFGNTAPLLVAMLFLGLRIGSPHYPGGGFLLIAIPFLYLFVAGVAADLLETAHRCAVWACIWGILSAYALWNVIQLAKLG